MSDRYDVVVIGGAAMGASTAFWLSVMDPALRVLVVEADPSFAKAATALSVASIRMQFSSLVNVKISRFGIDFVKNFQNYVGEQGKVPNLGLKENGYLVLSQTGEGAANLTEMAALQNGQGASTLLLSSTQLSDRFPWINAEGVTLASFGAKDEGWFDNMGLVAGLRASAKANGVTFVTDLVTNVTLQNGKVTSVVLKNRGEISCGNIVNAAGTRGRDVAAWAGITLPVEPRKRTVFVIDAPGAKHPDAPLLIDKGFYLRPEHNNWITATVPEDDKACDINDFEPDLHLFEDVIWEQLYHRAPEFDAVKVIRHWVGHYDFNTFDQNAFVGNHPDVSNMFVLNGFSGHGLQQSPALGRGTAELILRGRFESLDLSDLSVDRLISGRKVIETAII